MLYIFTYTIQKFRTHCVFERSLLCSSTVTLHVITNTEKTIILKCEILLKHKGFLFDYTLKYRPISVMQN